MPSDFPSTAFDSFVKSANLVDEKYRAANNNKVNPDWSAVASATNGLAYRWLALVDAEKTFGSTFIKATKTPENRYIEETALFAFFSNALSAIELSYFAIYGFAAQLEPTLFDLVRVNPRKITPENVTKKFNTAWPADALTLELSKANASLPFKDVTELRNVLSHRGTPARTISMHIIEVLGGPTPLQPPPTTSWSNRPMDDKLLPAFRADIAPILNDLIAAAARFATDQTKTRGLA
jgi:hypothetical protein